MSDRRKKFIETLKAEISKAEGTNTDSYNTTFGKGKYDPESKKKITEMTFKELKQFQKGLVNNSKGKIKDKQGNPVRDEKGNLVGSSAVGRYQIIRPTLFEKGFLKSAGLTEDDTFSAENQDKLFMALLKKGNVFKNLDAGKPKAAHKYVASTWASIKDPEGKLQYNQATSNTADKVSETIGDLFYNEAEQSVLERQKAKQQLKESANPLGDLNPLAPAMGNEMAENIENPDKKFKLVSGPSGKQPGKKFKLVSGPQPQQEMAAEPQEPARPERTMGQSFMQGVGQGFSYGYADEIAAGASTLNDMLTTDLGKQVMNDTLAGFTKAQLDGDDMPITRLADQYRKHRDDERALVDEYRGDNPMSYTAGEIAGTFLNYAAVGPLAFGAGMVTRGGKVLYGTLSGMAHGSGSSEEETIGGLAEDTARGGLIGGAGEAAFPAFKSGMQAVSDVAERVRSGALIKFLGGPGTDPRRRLGEVGKRAEEFAERMVNYNDADGTPLIKPFMNRQKLSDTLGTNADRIGDKMADILSDMDEAIGKPVINGYHLRNEVREQVIKPLMTPKSLPEDKAVGAALEDYIIKLTQSLKSVEQSVDPKTGANVLKEVFEPQTWALSDLAKQKSKLQSMYRKTRLKDADNITVGIAQGKDRIANVMGDFIDKELKGKNISPEISNQYNAFKQAYGDMAEASYIVKQQIERDAGKDIFQRIFNDSVVRYTSMASIAGTMVGLPYSKVGMAVAGFKALSESKRINGVAAKSAESAIKILQKNPEAAATIANRLVTSTALSADDFFDNMTRSLAELTFIDQPLARDPNEVIRRSDKLLHLVEDIDPEMAKNLSTAIDNRDLGSINALMDKLVKAVPAQYVQPGIGFGGRAFSEQDIAKVNSDIQNVRNTRRRKQLHNAFNNQSSDQFRMIPSELYEEKQSDPANFFQFRKKQNKFIKDY